MFEWCDRRQYFEKELFEEIGYYHLARLLDFGEAMKFNLTEKNTILFFRFQIEIEVDCFLKIWIFVMIVSSYS